MLKSYISVNVAPVLIDFASNINIPKSIIIPENTRIILTAKNISKETINEEIYSLVAHI